MRREPHMTAKGENMIGQPATRRRGPILVDVDTQSHFFRSDSLLYINDHRSVLDRIRKVFTWARNDHVHIISTVQVSNGGAVYTRSFLFDGFSVHKPAGTLCHRRILLEAKDCTDLPRRMVEHYDQVILQKRCFDPFAEPRCDRLFTELAGEFVLIGAPMEGAVKATALGLLARGKHVTVVVDATGSFSLLRARRALQQLHAKGARLARTDMLLRSLQLV